MAVKMTRPKRATRETAKKKAGSKGAPPGPGKRAPRGMSLSSLCAVRREMAAVYTLVKRNQIKEGKARTSIYALSNIAGILKAERELELEARVIALEEQLGVNPQESMKS